MNSTESYLKEFSKTATERLEYLNRRTKEHRNLEEEIEELYQRAKWDYQYICSILDGTEAPPVPEAVTSDLAAVRDAMPSKPTSYKRKLTPCTKGKPRPVVQMDQDGTVIQRFKSIKDASQATGMQPSYISIAANTNSYTKDGSFWRFEDSYGILEKNRPVVVVSNDGEITDRYESAFQAAIGLGVPFSYIQVILHTKSHEDEKKNLHYWYEDEYNAAHGNA